MFVQEVTEIKISTGQKSATSGRIVKILRETPPLVKDDPWTFLVLTEQER